MKLFKILILLISCTLLNIFSEETIFALEKDTHYFLNEKIVVGTNLDSYLKANLRLQSGIKEEFIGKKILEWIKIGGKTEDEPIYTRSLNHFHDPLKSWDNAGFKGTFKSSVIWAQNQGAFGSSFGGDWSWKKARENFYKGLTSTAKFDRDLNLAFTFQALGQLMHLVQDASVPAHVRNDAHIIGFHYELWVDKNLKNINLAPKPVDKSIFTQAVSNSSTPVPISALWDLDKYNGSNPAVTLQNNIGLSEYTNANFFSEDTIFKNYPHPTYDDTNYHIAFKYPEKVDAEDGRFDNRVYIRKTIGDANTKLAAFSYISYDVIKRGYYQFSPLILDSKVYKDYASLLIPRAVGYSAGLLDYFFRGDIDMVAAESGSGYVIENRTEEDMNGMFELWYDNAADQRTKIWSGTYSVGKKSSGNNRSGSFVINAPGDAKEPNKYMLVFRGKMGVEEDAVAGKMVSTEKEYLFLVNTTKTAAFEIRQNSNQYQLVPATKEINVTRYPKPSTLLTVQSHPNKKEHRAALPRTSFNPDGTIKHTTYTASIGNYGGQYEDTWWEWMKWYTWKYPQVVRGFPNAYIPQNFNEGSQHVWDGSLINGEWLYKTQGYYTYERLGSYIHGRRPFTVTDNKLVARNISIRKNEPYTYSGNDYTGPFYIQYKDQSGNWIRGMDLPDTGGEHTAKRVIVDYDCSAEQVSGGWIESCWMLPDKETRSQKSLPVSYLAVLDREKTMNTRADISEVFQYDLGSDSEMTNNTTTTYRYYNNWCNRTYITKKEWTANYKSMDGESKYSHKSNLVVGGAILEEFEFIRSSYSSNLSDEIRYFGGKNIETKIYDSNPGCYLYQGTSNIETIKREIGISGDTATVTINGNPYTFLATRRSQETTGKTLIKVMDYDHINGDEKYILFYEYQDVDSHSSTESVSKYGVYGTGDDARIIDFGQERWPPYNTTQTNITTNSYVLVYKINSLIRKNNLDIKLKAAHNLISGWNNRNSSSNGTSYAVDSTFEENKTTEGKRLTGVSSQINDKNIAYTYIVEKYDNGKWVFDKRIVGIINISDASLPIGYRQEFELDFSGMDFDITSFAAIGVTR